MKLQLIPIKEFLEDNKEFENHPDCNVHLEMSVMFYARVGYVVPWIGYYASIDHKYVGSAGFKGRPAFFILKVILCDLTSWAGSPAEAVMHTSNNIQNNFFITLKFWYVPNPIAPKVVPIPFSAISLCMCILLIELRVPGG